MGIISFLVLICILFLTFDELKNTRKEVKDLNNKIDRLTGYLMESKPLLEDDDLGVEYDEDCDPHRSVTINEDGLVTSINNKESKE